MRELLLSYEKKAAILEPNKEQRKLFLNFLGKYADDFIDNLDSELSFRDDNTKDVKRLSIDGDTHSLENLIEIFKEEVDTPGLNPEHGGHLGYIPGGGIFATAMGDFMAAVFESLCRTLFW